MPKLSLIVATVGRLDVLSRLLASLVKQDSRDFEVIVVDQGIVSKSQQMTELVTEFSEHFYLLYLSDNGRGLSRARNIGLRHVRGKYIGFPDDDCWYHEDLVGTVISFFENKPDFGILSGIYTEPGVENPNFSRSRCELSPRNFVGKVSSVGLFINKNSIEGASILFDDRIGAGTELPAAEETDLLLRLLLLGVKGVYDPLLVIYHQIYREKVFTKSDSSALRRAFWFVIGKNYQPIFSEVKLARGVASCLFRRNQYGIYNALQSMFKGYIQGLKARKDRLPVQENRN